MRPCLLPLLLLAAFSVAIPLAPVGAGDKARPAFKMSGTEEKLLELINKEREKAELKPLRPSPLMFKVARAHSANMAKHQELNHVLDNKNAFQRLKEGGYRYYFAGENIAFGDADFPLKSVIKGWMDSKLHRENILNSRFVETGLGLATDPKGFTYYTQVFGKPR
jgi:uncharacterized protein YkwD